MDFSEEDSLSTNPVLDVRGILKKRYLDGVPLAASMIMRDRWFLLLIFPLVIFPSWILRLIDEMTPLSIFLLTFWERVGSTLFFYLTARRWIKEFSSGRHPQGALPLVRLLLVGITLWAVVAIPSFTSILEESQVLQSVYVFGVLPSIGFLLQYYFYFFPTLMGRNSWRTILVDAQNFLITHRSLPLKVIVCPLILTGLFVALAQAFSPDGRYLWTVLVSDAAEAIFCIVNSYLSLAIALSIAAEQVNAPGQLDPYIRSRLDALRIKAPWSITQLIAPKQSLNIAIVAVLLMWGNQVRIWETPPAAKIAIESISKVENKLTLKLRASDPEFLFRGFKPTLFHIAGETGEPLSEGAPKIELQDEELNVLGGFPLSSHDEEFTLTFVIAHRADELTQLKDVYLWYAQVKMEHLSPRLQLEVKEDESGEIRSNTGVNSDGIEEGAGGELQKVSF